MTRERHDQESAGSRAHWVGLLLLFLLSFGLRWTAVEQFEANHPLAASPVIDELSYIEWGTRIAAGDWLGDEVFFQEPLYPYFIGVVFSVLGEDLHGLRLLQCVLGALTTLLIWSLTRDLFGRTFPGLAAAWLAAGAYCLYPPAIMLPCLFLKPNLFLPIFALFVHVLIRAQLADKRWLVLGVLGGLGALLRGNMLILLPCFFLWPFLCARVRKSPLRQALPAASLFALGVVVVLFPVFLRNYVVGDQFALTTSGAGTNVYGGNNGDNPYGVATEFPWVRGIPRYEAGDWRREAERRLGRDLNGSESSSYWLAQVRESMGKNPALHLSIFWNKLRLALNDYEVPDNHHVEWDARYVPLLQLPWPGFGVYGGLALGGLLLALWRRELSGSRWQVALVFVLYLGTIVVTVMSMRARLPLVVVLFPFFGYGGAQILMRARGQRLRLSGGISMLLGLLIAFTPVFSARERQQDLAERDYNLAVSWLEQEERLEEVGALAQMLVGEFPNSSRLQILLADTEWRRGTLARQSGEEVAGQAQVQRALARLKPLTEDQKVSPRERSRAFRLAGYIQADLGRWGVADRFLRSAREFAAEDPELLLLHARVLLQLSDDANGMQATEARELLQRLVDQAPESPEGREASALLGGR